MTKMKPVKRFFKKHDSQQHWDTSSQLSWLYLLSFSLNLPFPNNQLISIVVAYIQLQGPIFRQTS